MDWTKQQIDKDDAWIMELSQTYMGEPKCKRAYMVVKAGKTWHSYYANVQNDQTDASVYGWRAMGTPQPSKAKALAVCEHDANGMIAAGTAALVNE